MKQTNKTNTNDSDSPIARLKGKLAFDRTTTALLAASFVITAAIVLISTQFGSFLPLFRTLDYEVGSVAERDVVVERDILYTDERVTRLKREAAGKLAPPVFRVNEQIGLERLSGLDNFREMVFRLQSEESTIDTVFLKLQVEFPGILRMEQLARILDSPQPDRMFQQARGVLEPVYESGLIKLPEQDPELLSAGAIEVWRWQEGKLVKEEVFLEDVLMRTTLLDWIRERFPDLLEEDSPAVRDLVLAFAVDNGFLDLKETENNRREAMEEVGPVQAKLVEGQVIIRRGDIISQETAAQIKALGEYSATLNLNSIAGYLLYLLIVLVFSISIFRKRFLGRRLKRNEVFFLSVTVLAYLVLAAILRRFLPPFETMPFAVVLPTAAVSILITLIVSARAGFVFSYILALLILPIAKMDVYSFLFVLLTGVAGTAVVVRAERRIDLVRAGIYLSGLNMIILAFCSLLKNVGTAWLWPGLGWSILNGFVSGMISLAFLPILEHALNTASRFRLIELSDLNAPIMKRMLSLAPGTYNHSISVANLAESACSAIGANALLARVGAYYHDIGKIEQAEYFIENQRSFNKHDDLKPSLSAAVIKSHLKMGIEKARELSLPQEVQQIIAQHHGRGVIKYFYQRALDNGESSDIKSDDYSYQGYRPSSREAAVVMLADAVEAATRTLKKPTVAKLEKFVWDIIMDRFTSQDLGESELTLRDLDTIKKSFVQVLAGYYHSRIEYPKLKEMAR